jgi:hypothetical protein
MCQGQTNVGPDSATAQDCDRSVMPNGDHFDASHAMAMMKPTNEIRATVNPVVAKHPFLLSGSSAVLRTLLEK